MKKGLIGRWVAKWSTRLNLIRKMIFDFDFDPKNGLKAIKLVKGEVFMPIGAS